MEVGRRLIIDKVTNKVVYDFGEMQGDVLPRPAKENLVIVDLDYGQYSTEFMTLKDGINSIIVEDIENKVFSFDTVAPQPTYEELQQQLLIAQGVI